MIRWLVVLALVALSVSIPVVDHESEHTIQRQIFVDQLNAQPSMTWKAAINPRFHGLPIGASKDLCGVKPDSREHLLSQVKRGNVKFVAKADLQSVNIPDDFDSESNWPNCAKVIGDIRDQSNCGCCWAFGAAEAASDRMCIASNGSMAFPLSAEDVCFCSNPEGCDGGRLGDAWDYISRSGVVSGAQQTGSKAGDDPFSDGGFCSRFSLPHCHHHGPQGSDPYPAENAKGCPKVTASPQCPSSCDSDAKAPHNTFSDDKYSFSGVTETYENDADTIAAAIMKDGPVEAAFTVYSDFENYAGGVYSNKGGQMMGGHAIRIVGWGVESGTKYWKVANSWNRYWGEKGYFRIKRGTDECGIESQVTSSGAGAKWAKKGNLPPGPPGPPPGPPSPPGPGPADCTDNKSEGKCQAETGCHWCVPPGGGAGFCFSFPCGR